MGCEIIGIWWLLECLGWERGRGVKDDFRFLVWVIEWMVVLLIGREIIGGELGYLFLGFYLFLWLLIYFRNKLLSVYFVIRYYKEGENRGFLLLRNLLYNYGDCINKLNFSF